MHEARAPPAWRLLGGRTEWLYPGHSTINATNHSEAIMRLPIRLSPLLLAAALIVSVTAAHANTFRWARSADLST